MVKYYALTFQNHFNGQHFTDYLERKESMHFGLATPDEIAAELSTRLRSHRLAQNLPQSELAAMAGISRKTLTTFEQSGKVSLDVFLKLVGALGLSESLSTLFEYKVKSIREMELAEKRQLSSRKRARKRKP